jgi:hypothetical protein
MSGLGWVIRQKSTSNVEHLPVMSNWLKVRSRKPLYTGFRMQWVIVASWSVAFFGLKTIYP